MPLTLTGHGIIKYGSNLITLSMISTEIHHHCHQFVPESRCIHQDLVDLSDPADHDNPTHRNHTTTLYRNNEHKSTLDCLCVWSIHPASRADSNALVNPLTPTVAIWVKHPVPDRVKLSFVILTPGHTDAQPWALVCPDVKNYKWRLNPVWHSMFYSCTLWQQWASNG